MGTAVRHSPDLDVRHYREFLERNADGIWSAECPVRLPVSLPAADLAGAIASLRITDANEAAARMCGAVDRHSLRAGIVADLLQLEAPHLHEVLVAFATEGFRVEREVRLPGTGAATLVHTLTGIVEGGALVRIWGVVRDVTDQRRVSEQLRQAQKMDAIGQLAGGIAHDFNNVLTAILGYGEMLRDELGSDHPASTEVREILKAGRRAESLTRQLLAFSRKKALRHERVNLSDVVQHFAPMIRRLIPEDIDVSMNLAAGLPDILGDRGQFEQVLMNLALNARDAMPEGGALTIETALTHLDEHYVRVHACARKGPHVALTVSDTGHGMTREIQSRIFEPFFTTKGKKGTGLGLATVYGIVQQAGGNIMVYSEPGLGTTFRIYVPCTETASSAATEAPATPEVIGGTETVLVVEDDEAVRTLTVDALTRLGYTVLSAARAEEALSIAGDYPHRIDALVTDLVMPGIHGQALGGMLSVCRLGLRVLYTSGYAPAIAMRPGLEASPGEFLQKPYTPHTLARKLRSLLDSQ